MQIGHFFINSDIVRMHLCMYIHLLRSSRTFWVSRTFYIKKKMLLCLPFFLMLFQVFFCLISKFDYHKKKKSRKSESHTKKKKNSKILKVLHFFMFSVQKRPIFLMISASRMQVPTRFKRLLLFYFLDVFCLFSFGFYILFLFFIIILSILSCILLFFPFYFLLYSDFYYLFYSFFFVLIFNHYKYIYMYILIVDINNSFYNY